MIYFHMVDTFLSTLFTSHACIQFYGKYNYYCIFLFWFALDSSDDEEDSSLSVGAIVGIVISAIAAIAGVVFLIVMFILRLM